MRRSKRSRVAAEDDAEPAVEDGGGSSSSSAPATEDFQLALEREKLERQGEVAKLVAEKQRLSDSCLRLQQEKLALERRQRPASGDGASSDAATAENVRLRRDLESARRRVAQRDDELSEIESNLSAAKREASRARERSEDALRDAQDTERDQSARIASLEQQRRASHALELEFAKLKAKLEASEQARASMENRRAASQEIDGESRGLATKNRALESRVRAALSAHTREVKLRKKAEERVVRLTEESRTIALERARAEARVLELARTQVELRTAQEQLGEWRAALAQTLGALASPSDDAAAAGGASASVDAADVASLLTSLRQRTEAVAAESAALKNKATRDAAELTRVAAAHASAEAVAAAAAAEQRALEQRLRLAEGDVALFHRESARVREQLDQYVLNYEETSIPASDASERTLLLERLRIAEATLAELKASSASTSTLCTTQQQSLAAQSQSLTALMQQRDALVLERDALAQRVGRGEFNSGTTRVVHFSKNPSKASAMRAASANLDGLRAENARLALELASATTRAATAEVKVAEAQAAPRASHRTPGLTPSVASSAAADPVATPSATPQPTYEFRKYRENLLKQIHAKFKRMRDAVYRLTGYMVSCGEGVHASSLPRAALC